MHIYMLWYLTIKNVYFRSDNSQTWEKSSKVNNSSLQHKNFFVSFTNKDHCCTSNHHDGTFLNLHKKIWKIPISPFWNNFHCFWPIPTVSNKNIHLPDFEICVFREYLRNQSSYKNVFNIYLHLFLKSFQMKK